MTLVSSIIIGVVLILGLLNGLRRGGIKEGTALIGVLLGALLVEYWAERWGNLIFERSSLRIEMATWLVAIALLIGTALFSGYGSGILMRRGVMKTEERLSGALLGLLNMGLLVSFVLRYTQQFYFTEADPAQPIPTWIRTGVVTRIMLDWISFFLIGAAIALAVVSLVVATLRIGRLVTQASPNAGKKPQAGGKPQQPQQKPRTDGGFGGPPPQPKIPAGQQEKFLDSWPPKNGQ